MVKLRTAQPSSRHYEEDSCATSCDSVQNVHQYSKITLALCTQTAFNRGGTCWQRRGGSVMVLVCLLLLHNTGGCTQILQTASFLRKLQMTLALGNGSVVACNTGLHTPW
jgi:hypothetical protein